MHDRKRPDTQDKFSNLSFGIMRLRCKEIAKEIFAERASVIAGRLYAERAALRGQRKDSSENLQISSTHKLETQVSKITKATLRCCLDVSNILGSGFVKLIYRKRSSDCTQ